ncbi:hypothetical protein EU538_00565 [Candidatus Thorarchaeota archaeon]|jgi:hypothetical protein|nr:MAG: hypothetical protein EU538_00565 [Candidatus Thorarchaeota archaeon]
MDATEIPWSFFATIASFGVFFFSLNVYLLTLWLDHPWANPLWLIPTVGGLFALVFSLHWVRIHQAELQSRQQSAE